ncbi:MAG: AAA family ATPase [Chloroflexi bacterium]|nr:AAA family ATPase [Chloroflexota bacterium]
MGHPPLVEGLLDPQAYPEEERPGTVEMLETHISYLFFTGRYVYKVKKPVDFGFLDFTTLEKRRHFCQEEVRLNRRLSPGVYLDVAEVRERDGGYYLFGPGNAVEYAVKMRQLPRQRAMAEMLRRGEVQEEHLRALATKVETFHRGAESGPETARLGGLAAVRENVAENFAQTETYLGVTLTTEAYDAIRAYSDAFLQAREDLFRRREREGRVRDCHGDLHTDQVFLLNDIAVIDCIEFNQRFRYSDVAADVAFLAMDLAYHGRRDLARVFVDQYIERSGDQELRDVLDFYCCYRAYVRGKVESFRLDLPSLQDPQREGVLARAVRYFALAREYARLVKGPALLITTGLMGTGKSTVAQAVAARLGGQVVSSDVVRKELAGVAPTERRYEPWGGGIYGERFDQQTYGALLGRAREALDQGTVVVLDASYRRAAHRQQVRELAQSMGVPFFALEVVCPEEVVRGRLAAREAAGRTVSDGRWELFRRQQEAFEPLTEVPPEEHVVVDGSLPLKEIGYHALRALYLKVLGNPQCPQPS